MISAWLNVGLTAAEATQLVSSQTSAIEVDRISNTLEPAVADALNQDRIDDQLVVHWRHKSVSVETRTALDAQGKEITVETTVLRFTGGVKADYGPTHLESDELELRLDDLDKTGYARGDVRLTDPEGVVTSDALDFQWREGTAHAINAYVRIASLGIRAADIRVTPENWILTDSELDPNVGGMKIYTLAAPTVDIRPGSKGIVRHLGVTLFGKKVVVIPRLAFSLRQGPRGLQLPGFSIREGGRPGITWDNDFEFGERTLLSTGAAFFADRKPSGALTLSYDLLGHEAGGALSEPHSDLSDPFHNGYFDNIAVKTPENERRSVGTKKEVLAVSGSYFQRVSGREALASASKPWELVLDLGRTYEGFAQSLQMRYQQIEGLPGESIQRFVAIGATSAPSVRLSPQIGTVARLDYRGFLNPGSNYGWARGTLGVTASPSADFTLGASYSAAGEYGVPAYQFDRPWPLHSANARADLMLGPRSISAMYKYDPGRGKWYDREFAFYQVAGSFSLYAVWRQFPGRFSLGFELRTLDIIDRLKTRTRNRAREKPGAKP